ncbi:MAG: transposase, partial [Oscillospiraceae bacterium]|nr:transposase [Oscillospiraceae bacterium]
MCGTKCECANKLKAISLYLKCDPEARSTKKGNNWHFKYKAHIGVDKKTGFVHHLKTTAANEHDVTVAAELLSGKEKTVYGDSGYLGIEKRPEAILKNKKGKKIKYRINQRPSMIQKLSENEQAKVKKKEHKKSSVRCKVEHVF